MKTVTVLQVRSHLGETLDLLARTKEPVLIKISQRSRLEKPAKFAGRPILILLIV
ncbi:MAG: hypothetical protein AB1611_05960 [bacterium]